MTQGYTIPLLDRLSGMAADCPIMAEAHQEIVRLQTSPIPKGPRVVDLAYCRIESDGWKVIVRFPDGEECHALPNMNAHYHVISHRCGYNDDVAAYCFEHEVAHAYVAQFLWGRKSDVLWALAQGRMLKGPEAAPEEILAQTLQRFARANEQPIVGGVNWFAMREGFLRAVS